MCDLDVFYKTYAYGRWAETPPPGDPLERAKGVLANAYGPSIGFTKPLAALSAVVRSEYHAFEADAARVGTRVHVFDRSRLDAQAPGYLGCCGLRSGSTDTGAPPIADSFLAVPPSLVSSNWRVPCAGYLSCYVGLMPFLCTPYMMHNRSRGSLCAQGAIYLSLLLMSRFGVPVYDPFEITALAKAREDGCFEVDGLTVREMMLFAQKAGISSAHYSLFPFDEPPQGASLDSNTQSLLSCACCSIIAWLEAGIPVICLADFESLYHRATHPDIYNVPRPPTGAHAILLVGYRSPSGRYVDDYTALEFLYHDGTLAPYLTLKAGALITAAVKYTTADTQDGRAIMTFQIARPSVHVNVDDCAQLLQASTAYSVKKYPYRYAFFCPKTLLRDSVSLKVPDQEREAFVNALQAYVGDRDCWCFVLNKNRALHRKGGVRRMLWADANALTEGEGGLPLPCFVAEAEFTPTKALLRQVTRCEFSGEDPDSSIRLVHSSKAEVSGPQMTRIERDD